MHIDTMFEGSRSPFSLSLSVRVVFEHAWAARTMNCNRLWSASTTYRGRFVADQAHHVHHLRWTKVHERVLAISVERPVIVFWPTSISQLSDLGRGSRIHTRSWLSRSPFYSFSSFYFLFFPRISRHRRLTHLRNNRTRLLWRAST